MRSPYGRYWKNTVMNRSGPTTAISCTAPLYRNEETPSFMVNLHTNKWKDFGEDSSGGVADLVMRLERCDFHSAMRRIEKSDLSAPSDPSLFRLPPGMPAPAPD